MKSRVYKYMTSVSRNVYNDKWDDIVNRYNYTYYKTIKMKPVDVKDNTYIDFGKNVNNENPKFKNWWSCKNTKYQNTKWFLLKDILQIGLKKFLWLKKWKILFHGNILLVILKVNKLLKHFMKKNCKKQIKKCLELRK